MQNYATMFYADMTQYGRLYRERYWGLFTRAVEGLDEIVANRDRFVDDFNINANSKALYPRKAVHERVRAELGPWADHLEYYRTHGKPRWLALASPYSPSTPVPPGWTPIYALYLPRAVTIVKKL